MLPHTSEEDRKSLIDRANTLLTFNVVVDELGKYSSQFVMTTCVVCHSLYKKQYKQVLLGKGLTCSTNCTSQLRSYKQKHKQESPDARDRRLQGIKDFHKDPGKVAQKLERMKKTNLAKYGVESAIQNQEIKEVARQNLLNTIAEQNEQIIQKRQKTNMKRYGVANPFQDPNFQEQLRQRNQEKYGVDYLTQHPEFHQRKKLTLLEKYGVENPTQSKELMEKKKQTCLDKYGHTNPRSSPEIQKRIEDTCEERYGIRNLLADATFRKKGQETLLEKYGVSNPGLIKGHHERIKNVMLKRYGVEHFKQLPSERNKLNQWCEENPEKLFTSKGEQEVLDWIRSYYPSARKHKQEGHEIDIFIPELSLGIEYNGLYWHSEVGLKRKEHNARMYHIAKTKYFEDQNIRLIHIWEHEWRDRPHQVKSFILSAINKNSIKLNPRQCEIIWSNSKEEINKAHSLLDSYHIQGHVNSTKYVVNVYYQNELIATATFGKHHRNNEDWVLSRFCAKMNYTVRGLLGKISKLAYSKLNQPLISWADYRLSQGNGYLKAGWRLEETLPPDYFYHKNGSVVSKQSRQKRLVGTSEDMTEAEHAKLDGLERVWDCGKIRFVYERKELKEKL
jgi:hypothetical protein